LRKKINELLDSPLFARGLVNTAIALIFMAVYGFLCRYSPMSPVWSGLLVGGMYLVLVILTGLMFRYLSARVSLTIDSEIKPMLGNITLDLIVKLWMPVIICDESGKIIWYNKAFSALTTSKESLFGRNFEMFADLPISVVMADERTEGVDIVAFNGFFRVKGYKMSSGNKNYDLTVWNDRTELNRAYKKLSDEVTLIAYIMIDNFDELMQFISDKYRSASSEVEAALVGWAQSVGGVLKEYERDRYMFFFDSRFMASFIENRFDILDTIREIRVGESSLPVTVSVGIAQINGTLSDKERAAHAALDMALQRGGDQVVVKNETGLDFYGGRTKTVQKRTKVRARVVANELAAQVSKSSRVLIMGHRNPDFDSIGACVGMARLVMMCGVKVNIVTNTRDQNFARCRERLRMLPEYRDSTLFMSGPEAQEAVTSSTLLIILDVNNRTQFEAPELADIIPNLVIIDHHRKNAEFTTQPVIAYIEPSASSACELVAEILEQSLPPGMLNKEEADIMYGGILLDTKQFTRNTGVRTFSAMLYLRGEGANPADAQTLFKTELAAFMREAKYESDVVIYRSVIAISADDSPDNTQNDRIAVAKAADKLLSIDSVLASFVLCRIGDTIYISARSMGSVNVQLILERLEGGGHYDAAATVVTGVTMSEALTRLKESIDEYLSNQ
jgi:Predicted signaling protein consisting of a modified GGDEF domain and a DHH domain